VVGASNAGAWNRGVPGAHVRPGDQPAAEL